MSSIITFGASGLTNYNPIKAQRARACRICSFLLIQILIHFVSVLANLEFLAFSSESEYSEESLKVEVFSCDVFVKSGDKHLIRMDGLFTSATERQLQRSGDKLKIVRFENTRSCNDQPFMHCEHLCRITITIPENRPPEELWIYQSNDDVANNVRVHIRDVSLKTLWIRGPERTLSQRAGPTIEVVMQNVVVTGEAKLFTKRGPITIDDVVLPETKVDIRSEGSVSLYNMNHTSNLDLQWRQPMNSICVTPTLGHLALPDPSGLFGQCLSDSKKFAFQAYYDPRKDYKIDTAEFGEQLVKLPYCCGHSCPHKSSCTSFIREIFPYDNSSTSWKDTSNNVFDRIVELGYPGVLPGCYQQILLTDPVVKARTATGYPPYVLPSTAIPPVVIDVTTIDCRLNEDCLTKFCNGATFKCGPNPQVTYTTVESWGTCTKLCGGGQQLRKDDCVGSDGLEYPLSLCTLSSSASVRSCNTQACQLPVAPSSITLSSDVDLREGFVRLNATVNHSTNSTKVVAYLGTSTTMLDPAIAEFTSCNVSCQLNVSTQLASYVDRLYVVAANSHGKSPALASVFIDRVGNATVSKWSILSSGGRIVYHNKDSPQTPWSPEEGMTGIKLNLADAKLLMKEVGPKVGDPDSSGTGFIVIRTVASPGLPALTWVYSPQLVHFAVDPAYLNFFSGGLLTPDIYQYRVSFQDNTCPNAHYGLTRWDFSSEEHQKRLVEMYSQLAKALRSSGSVAEDTLRGRLMVLSPDDWQVRLPRDGPVRWAFHLQEDGSTTMSAYKDGWLEASLQWAMALSLCAGILFALLATAVVWDVGRKALQDERDERIRQKRMLARKLGEKASIIEEQAIEVDPFKNPLLVIQVLVVAPMRRRLVNSLRRFVDEMVDVTAHSLRKQITGSRTMNLTLGSKPASSLATAKVQDIQPVLDDEALKRDPETGNLSSLSGPPLYKHGTSSFTNGVPYVTMRIFRRAYEEYCIEHGLDAVTRQETIMRSLVQWHRLRATQHIAWRLRGVRWREAPLVVESHPSSEEEGAKDGDKAPPVPMIDPPWTFCDSRLEVTHINTRDFVEYYDRLGLKGERIFGVQTRYADFCKQLGLSLPHAREFDPTDPGNAIADWCREREVAYQEVTKTRIKHCKLREYRAVGRGYRSMLMEQLHMACTLVIMIAPGATMIAYVMDSQVVFARTLALQDALTWYDVYANVYPFLGYCVTDKETLLLTRLITAWQLTYCVLAQLCVMWNYAEISSGVLMKRIFGHCMFLVFTVEVVFMFSWMGTIAAWCMLSAILDPKSYLGIGTAIATVGLTILVIWRQMRSVIQNVHEKVMKAVKKHMQELLRQLKANIVQRMHEDATHKLDLRMRTPLHQDAAQPKPKPVRVSEGKAGFDAFHADVQKEITVSDVFALLDTNGEGLLSTEEFRSLFSTLGNKMKPSHIEQLFACCDTDGSGKVSEEELEEGWEFIIRDIVRSDMRELGATTTEIVLAIVIAALMLLALFCFIFFALRGWSERSDLGAVVQGVMVAASGKLVTHVRKRVPAETGNIDTLVEELEKEEQEDDGEAGE